MVFKKLNYFCIKIEFYIRHLELRQGISLQPDLFDLFS